MVISMSDTVPSWSAKLNTDHKVKDCFGECRVWTWYDATELEVEMRRPDSQLIWIL